MSSWGRSSGVPRLGVTEERPAHPGVGGEDQVAQGLDERPLAVDALVQLVGRKRAGALDGAGPEPLDDVPGLAVAGGVGRAHLGPVGVPPVELGLDERRDVDAVDADVLDVAGDVDVLEPDVAGAKAPQVDLAERRTAQVDVVEGGAVEVDVLEEGAGQPGPFEAAPVWSS